MTHVRNRLLALVCAAIGSAGCDTLPDTTAASSPSASTAPLAPPRELDETVVPARRPVEPNPLGLPAANVTFTEGQFVYAVPAAMLATAKPGSSLELRAAAVETMDGHDVIVRIGTGSAYTIHAGYLVAPKLGRVQRGSRVIVPHREHLRHGVVQREVKKQVVVRYGDAGIALGDQAIASEEVGVLGGGLEPGAYALAEREHGLELVLLVSLGTHADGVARWFALGAEGEARLIEASAVSPVPDARKLKPGSSVLVGWHGDMVPATLRSIEPTGLLSVKRPRVGPAWLVGADMVMPAPEPAAPK